tara:strand:+ start:354 stop:749 length:396 start_codon:yes stop_codon:yes gene_type:complete
VQKIGIITGGFFMLTAVILGAFGAHGLKEIISPEDILTFKTGVLYQFVHGLSILILVLSSQILKIDKFKYSIWLFIIGIIFFSGSLYLLTINALLKINTSFIVPLTPLGGLLFITGWVLVIIFTIKSKNFK